MGNEITTVGIVTRDRLPSLVRCLESYRENCQRHGRSPEFVVADDSSSSNRDALKGLGVRYAGRAEKIRFAAALAEESAVAPEIVHFALFGDPRCALSTGANRNSLLLDSAGTLMLAVDDDTLCRVAAAPGGDDTLSSFSGYDPTEFWFFPDRGRAIQSVSPVDADVLACHEALLGSDGVAMTLNGLVGDSGMASPRYYLSLTGASRERLVASPEAYRSAFESREIVRSVRQATITAGPFCMTTFLGLDNRLLLPPFFPVERNSDGIFGLMVRKCVEGSRVAFLPWILLHAPEPPRAFVPEKMWTDAASLRMSDLVIACILDQQGAELTELGRHLRWLGSLDISEFEARIRTVQQYRNFAFITALHGQLHAYGSSPSFWADDVRRMIEVMSQAPSAEDYLVPRDLRHGDRGLAQELIGKFGEVLEAWPAMVAAAVRLRVGGCRGSEAV